MPAMTTLFSILPPMLCGVQLLLTLVLYKGDICPGQRGRIHKLIPAIGLLWLALASQQIEALGVALVLFYFYSQVQTNKTRNVGPRWSMLLSCIVSVVYLFGINLSTFSLIFIIHQLLLVLFLGAIFGHLLLVIARSRLQSFHQLLPFTGIVSALGIAIMIMISVMQFDEAQLQPMIHYILTAFGLMIGSIIIWSWHLLTKQTVNKIQLSGALLCAYLSMFYLQVLL